MGEVSIGDNDFQVFADLDFADEYLSGDVQRAAPWSLKNEDAKGRGLVSSTRVLQRWLLPDVAANTETPPDVLKQAASLYAADLLARPTSVNDSSPNTNVKTARAGSASVEFFRPVTGAPPLPTYLWDMLNAAGLLSASVAEDGDEGPTVSGSDYGCLPAPGAVDRWRWDCC
jgi:hypothetical protein